MSMPSGFPQVGIILYPVLENTEASLILSLYNFNRFKFAQIPHEFPNNKPKVIFHYIQGFADAKWINMAEL